MVWGPIPDAGHVLKSQASFESLLPDWMGLGAKEQQLCDWLTVFYVTCYPMGGNYSRVLIEEVI